MRRMDLVVDDLKEAALSLPILSDVLDDDKTMKELLRVRRSDPHLCRKAYLILAPILIGKGHPAPEKFLGTLYDALTGHVFPNSDYPDRALTEEEHAFVRILEALLIVHDGKYDPLLDILPFDRELVETSLVRREYLHFEKVIAQSHYLVMLRLTREVTPFDIASHMIGVHNVALHTAIMASRAGVEVDLPMISAAAIAHDIGKYGCRGEDAKRVPWLHYYFTWQWFAANNMETIGHVSANHSTWDLEVENLPIESLLLVYADFRVRGSRNRRGEEVLHIYSLEETHEIIASKLSDMTPEKQHRYQAVYAKLYDFEQWLRSKGIPTDVGDDEIRVVEKKDPSLMDGKETLRDLRLRTLEGSMHLMQIVSREVAYGKLLEQAKSEKTQHKIRTYLALFAEYNTYMINTNKKKLLVLLYELLAHADGDVRRQAGEIMGQILAGAGPSYQKERPSAADDTSTPTMTDRLDDSIELWKHYLGLCLRPDRKTSPKHAQRIANSLKTICASLFATAGEERKADYMASLIEELLRAKGTARFVLADAFYYVPADCFPTSEYDRYLETMQRWYRESGTEVRLKLAVLFSLWNFKKVEALRERINAIVEEVAIPIDENRLALMYRQQQILDTPQLFIAEEERSQLFLSNLKNAVHWTVKLAQISLLSEQARKDPAITFQVALHFANLLCVSEHLPVRESAGRHLITVAPYLTVDQINEIGCDLLREMETGQDQITRFIPPYLGRILSLLPQKELEEQVRDLKIMTESPSAKTACVGHMTVGELLLTRTAMNDAMTQELLGILMTGIAHYDDTVHQTALKVLCNNIFSSDQLRLDQKGVLFVLLHKKLNTLLSEPRQSRLTMFNSAAMLNALYRFMINYEIEEGDFRFPRRKPVAFFPGTFDPFSEGHKKIVREIREMGFEVFLAIDEFSWSKKTLAKLLRRQIASISIADQWDTYLFPDDVPINIAKTGDLANLKRLMRGRKLYLVAGSDVIENASAYRTGEKGSAAECNHIIFCRGKGRKKNYGDRIKGEILTGTLPDFYETVSSTRIRDDVDRRLDISTLVNPIVQSLIYERGLYVRAPETKSVLIHFNRTFVFHRSGDEDIPKWFRRAIDQHGSTCGVSLWEDSRKQSGWVSAHSVLVQDIFETLKSIEVTNFVRRHTSGKILFVDALESRNKDRSITEYRLLLNELLARSLDENSYAICRADSGDRSLKKALQQLGFLEIPDCRDIYYVDMRMPVVLMQDMMLELKKPFHDYPAIERIVMQIRPRLRLALANMFPGKLLLCFDSELLNQSLVKRIKAADGGEQEKGTLARHMCVPYGKILSDVVIPGMVTKTLHVEKYFWPDLRHFEISQYPNYSPIANQVRMLKSFYRPVILVDDILHNCYRINKLDKVFRQEDFSPAKIIVAIMSGKGRDLMHLTQREVECEYFIPNLHYWITESLLYPFIGGDSMLERANREQMLPSINLILPYYYPNYLADASQESVIALSRVALENTQRIMEALENTHQKLFDTTLTIRRLGEVLEHPRLPEQNSCTMIDFSTTASDYIAETLVQLERISKKDRYGDV